MAENRGKDSSAESMDPTRVLALEAPPLPSSSVRLPKPKKMKRRVNEKKQEGSHVKILTIDHGQDIGEKVLNYFRNSANSSGNSNRRAQMGVVLSATGSVWHPKMDAECSSASDKGSYDIISLDGRYIISEDGQVQQCEPLTITCIGSSGLVIRDQINGRLVAASPIQVKVFSFALNRR